MPSGPTINRSRAAGAPTGALLAGLLLLLLTAGCSQAPEGPTTQDVARDYTDLAAIVWADSLAAAERLQRAVDTFLAAPGAATLAGARRAWREARIPYSQSEAFRFAHPVVDEWEPGVNAWPLDEGFIDYVDPTSYAYEMGNAAGRANLIASDTLMLGGERVSLEPLTPALLARLNEAAGSEANVATGWHAIEFLLWGQDLNGTGPGAGERPPSDFMIGSACTHGHCERRRAYLAAVTERLVNDLRWMHAQWAPATGATAPDADLVQSMTERTDAQGGGGNYRTAFLALPAEEQLRRMLYALGSLSLGELAGERMRVALFANSTEDEHDCFSDNTHSTLYFNAVGIANVLRGEYLDSAGDRHEFASLLGLVERQDAALSRELAQALEATEAALAALVMAARDGQHFDQLIAPGNEEGAAMIQQGIDALAAQTGLLERMAATLGVSTLEGPDDA